MLKMAVIITCDRCGASESQEADYRRRGESELMNSFRHDFFHHTGRSEYWTELTDDIRHLCPVCSGEAAEINKEHRRQFNKWINREEAL
jgi:hypothetical protein